MHQEAAVKSCVITSRCSCLLPFTCWLPLICPCSRLLFSHSPCPPFLSSCFPSTYSTRCLPFSTLCHAPTASTPPPPPSLHSTLAALIPSSTRQHSRRDFLQAALPLPVSQRTDGRGNRLVDTRLSARDGLKGL